MIPSPNHSSRGNAKVRLVVVHTAEGARTVESLGAYFAKSSVQASSHVGIDDNRVEQYVSYDRAAWTCRSANPISDQVELCGFASWSRDQWLKEHPKMVGLAAAWIRERCLARGIPIVKLTPAQLAAGQPGVIGHVDWTTGMREGSHTDPGPGFPWDVVMSMANQGGPAPTPTPAGKSRAQILADNGMQRADEVVELADATGLDLAAACAMLVMETGDKNSATGGGRNVWGGDNVPGKNVIYQSGSQVTPEVYAKYIAAVKAGKAGRQGVGPTQLTWGGYQDECDRQGGTWDWRANVRYGFTVLAGHIKAKGLQGGFTAYNGGSAYGVAAMKVYQTYKQRLANATSAPEDDDMTPDQVARLARVERALEILVQQVCGEASTIENPFPGAAKGGGWECSDGVRRTLVDIGRHGLEKLDG